MKFNQNSDGCTTFASGTVAQRSSSFALSHGEDIEASTSFDVSTAKPSLRSALID